MAKKQTTINELARIVKQGFSEVKKDIDDLAMATKKEFDQVHQEFDQVHQEINGLKLGQENVELKLTNVAYRFELQELQQRVEILEKEIKLRKK